MKEAKNVDIFEEKKLSSCHHKCYKILDHSRAMSFFCFFKVVVVTQIKNNLSQ